MGTERGSQNMPGTGQQGKYCLDEGVVRYNEVTTADIKTAPISHSSPFAIIAKVRMMKRLVRLTVERLLVDRTVRGFRRYLQMSKMGVDGGYTTTPHTCTVGMRTSVGPEPCNVQLRNKLSQSVHASPDSTSQLYTQRVCAVEHFAL